MTESLFANRYRIERRIGIGGMSTVELAFDTRLERYVALKLLAEHLAEDPGFVSRFRREALAAAKLTHPNVVSVFDFGSDEESGRQFIAMEYVDGESCAQILRRTPSLSPQEAVDILTQACRGLFYAHRNNVIHRDVKPGNLLRNHEGVVKLADFGIAKAAELSDITKVGSVLGTAAYLSPEQTHGEPAQPPSDQYALGVVAYQMLVGRLPYQAASLPELARMQEAGLPRPPHECNREVSPELSDVIMRSLSPKPESRFANTADMETALLAGLAGHAVAVGSPTAATAVSYSGAADEASTQILSPSGLRSPRKLEPLQGYPAPLPPRERTSRSSSQRKQRDRRNWPLVTLLFLIIVASAGVAVYLNFFQEHNAAVHLRPNIRGDLQQSIQQVRGLIQENTQ